MLATEASVSALNGRGYDRDDVLPHKNYTLLMLPDSRRKKIKKILSNDKEKRSQEGTDDHVGHIHPSLVTAATFSDPFAQATMVALSEHLQNDFTKLLLNSTLDDDVTILFGEKTTVPGGNSYKPVIGSHKRSLKHCALRQQEE
jgi:hypothetical protein